MFPLASNTLLIIFGSSGAIIITRWAHLCPDNPR